MILELGHKLRMEEWRGFVSGFCFFHCLCFGGAGVIEGSKTKNETKGIGGRNRPGRNS